jgi:hypothetical protein
MHSVADRSNQYPEARQDNTIQCRGPCTPGNRASHSRCKCKRISDVIHESSLLFIYLNSKVVSTTKA